VLLVPFRSRLASRPLALLRTALPVSIRPKQLLPRRLTVAKSVAKASIQALDRRHPASTRPARQDSTRLRTTPLTILTVVRIAGKDCNPELESKQIVKLRAAQRVSTQL
jgi:hypothetical protein